MSLDLSSRMLIEWQCSTVIHQIAYFQDIEDFDSMTNLYTADGEYNSTLGSIKGRNNIRARYGHVPGLTARHIITNILFLEVEENRAESVCYDIDYFSTGEVGENPFLNAMLFELRDTFQRTDDGWRIRSRTPKTVFAPACGMDKIVAMINRAGKSYSDEA